MQIREELSGGWMGGSVATHKGVRVDDVVDSPPRLSSITVAEQDRAESSGLDLLDSVALGSVIGHDGRDPCQLTSVATSYKEN